MMRVFSSWRFKSAANSHRSSRNHFWRSSTDSSPSQMVSTEEVFKCGNVAICARMSHKIADASLFLTFIKNWAATARHLETYVICPDFVAAKVFPPKDDGGFNIYMGAAEKNIVLKRFEFRNSVIAALKERYAHQSTTENLIRPTCVEA
ncbi:hypothetical protein Q3G72_030928 [Acer saccharum]|nr:hypothetical protein Q3G72_030928 [Acer saccharum]